MTSSAVETVDLLDLKLLPAWVKEPADSKSYAGYTEEEDRGAQKRWRGAPRGKPKHRTPINREQASDSDKSRASIQHPTPKVERRYRDGLRQRSGARDGRPRGSKNRRRLDRHPQFTRTPSVTVRFLPYSLAFENVVAQIKSGSVAYSVFALARNSFRFAQRDFYQMDVVETDPIKGNFSNVARCRLSGTLLGPTNYHNYQPQLRSLYEQRFSRRMSFADYQRQIDVMSDAELIERWKEEARKITTYTTLREASSLKFSSALEAERHFRSHYLPGLIRDVGEATFGGGLSRRLPDRMLNQAIEEAWMRETRSPSDMMQELAGRFRQNGLHVFRHRRGMLFISPIRPRAFAYEQAGVSPSVNAILEALGSAQRSTGKQLFERLIRDSAGEHAEARSLAVASDLRWLINEGYVIEFNDGSLDLPRRKSKQQQETVEALAAASAGAVDTTTSTRSWPLQLTWPEQ